MIKYKGKGREVSIPDSVTSIGENAFEGCKSIASITIPDSVTSIENNAFEDCKSIASITIPDSVTSIGDKAFYGCKSIASITIPDSVTSIGDKAFYGCNAKILYYGSIKQWTYKGVKKLDLVENFTELYASGKKFSDEVLKNNKSYIKSHKKKLLEKVAKSTAMMTYFTSEKLLDLDDVEKLENLIDSNVEINAILLDYKNKNFSSDFVDKHTNDKIEKELGIKERTLTEWKKIYTLENDDKNGGYILKSYKDENKEIIIPDTIGKKKVTAIGEYCFSPDQERLSKNIRAIREKITSVLIPECVQEIRNNAFSGCSSLTSVTIPDSVTSIGDCAFYGCSSLTSVTIPNSVTSIESSAFEDTPWLENYSNDFVIVGNGCLIKYKGKESCISIPDSVTSIGDWAFEDCSSLTSVMIPDSVTSIGYSAFRDCYSLTSVTIPNSVTSIECDAFESTPWLENYSNDFVIVGNGCLIKYKGKESCISIPDSVTSIGDCAFYGCSSLTSVTIPISVTSIGDNAFYNCKSLANITIPDSVTRIERYAFDDSKDLTITAKAGSCAAEYAHNRKIKLIET